MKIILLAITLSCFIGAQAQVRIGVQGGYNHARLSPGQSSSNLYSYSTSGFRGFNAGAVAEIKVSENWILRPALLINGKGTRLETTGFANTSKRFIELHYLELPIAVIHKWNAGKKFTAFAGGGMYIARAFRGIEKGEATSLGGPSYIYNRVKFSSHNENSVLPTVINRFDYGFNVMAGVQRKSMQLLVSYGKGLQRVFPKSPVFEDRFTNRVFSLSAVHLFKNPR